MNPAIHNSIILLLVHLGIHNRSHIGSAGCSYTSAKFKGQFHLTGHLTQHFRKLCQKWNFIKIIALEIEYRKSRSEFKFFHPETFLRLQSLNKGIHICQLPSELFDRSLLSPWKELDSFHFHPFIRTAHADRLNQHVLIHAKLIAACQSEQQSDLHRISLGKPGQQQILFHGFRRKNTDIYTVPEKSLHNCRRLIYTG